MYLKTLELVGFKSFAEKTKLEFDRGITAIVGPNGCGKSNIADAIRWVLGEQSARALRGSKMEDCIFNGTDTHKPLGMAEVSITLGDCEKTLGTEYNEVTVTRRVLRTGEGQYFINKTLCRLKDIQRLFMDTGIGTNSYAVMEQGKIDMILSARPEDRRAVFEEASGITKYKADKKEALRKLEHTEANLLRLADIIREVRRQIISLQRQAGKARRYKSLQERLRSMDIYATRERLTALDEEIRSLEGRQELVRKEEEALHAAVEAMEKQAEESRTLLNTLDRDISVGTENMARLEMELERIRELIRVNRDRIEELNGLSVRDARDLEDAAERLRQHREGLEALLQELHVAVAARDEAERELNEQIQRIDAKDREIEAHRKRIHDLGCEAVDLESQTAALQNELTRLDVQERATVIRRERLTAEQAELRRVVEQLLERQQQMENELQALRQVVEAAESNLTRLLTAQADCHRQRDTLNQQVSDLSARLAAINAQSELLREDSIQKDGFPSGSRALLTPDSPLAANRANLLGPLAEHLRAEPGYELALEAALRLWLDALVVNNAETAIDCLTKLRNAGAGSVRLLALDAATPVPETDNAVGTPLRKKVACSPEIAPLVSQILANVYVIGDLGEAPAERASDVTYVTPDGFVLRGGHAYEYWSRGNVADNPLTRRHLLQECEAQSETLKRQKAELEAEWTRLGAEEERLGHDIALRRKELEEKRHQLSLQEGEKKIIDEEANNAQKKLETVGWELEALVTQYGTGNEQRGAIRRDMENAQRRLGEIRGALATANERIRFLERERTELASLVADARVRHAERRQQVDHLESRREPLEARIRELQDLMQNRSAGVTEYRAKINDLEKAISEAEQRIGPLTQTIQNEEQKLNRLRQQRQEKLNIVMGFDQALREKRAALEEARQRRSELDVELAEQRIRRQNIIERLAAEYRITPEQMAAEPAPEWENGQAPDRETLETMIAEIRAKLDAMGPVNLVAIEEYQEHEQRYAFLTQQQEDLLKAKQQLMDLIRKINKTTTELFSTTFQTVNANFQEMFRKLFGGGTAKLVLVNEEDVLESGIEIIARPPGKKLQNVSLLSGGERTLTAVALLFALYMVKPSPFCLLDELDAALDETNIGRFTSVLKDFANNSQFIVITHNRQTIAAAETLYGVTMEQKGVSKIVSVRFSHHEKPSVPTSPSRAEQPIPAHDASVSNEIQ